MNLLGRGVEFVRNAVEPALADLALQVVLRLHEKVESSLVEVDGEEHPLVELSDLLEQKLDLLDAYLRTRGGRDPQCLATARYHLAECLDHRELWTPLDWEHPRATRLPNQWGDPRLDYFQRRALAKRATGTSKK